MGIGEPHGAIVFDSSIGVQKQRTSPTDASFEENSFENVDTTSSPQIRKFSYDTLEGPEMNNASVFSEISNPNELNSLSNMDSSKIVENLSDSFESCHIVNLERLAPAKLLVFKIQINGINTRALIDTGASNNLIKKSIVEKLKLDLQTNSNLQILGLGSEKVNTLGNISSEVHLFGQKSCSTKFEVIEDQAILYPVILGRSFCAENRLVIDVAKRKISKVNTDGSRVSIFLNSECTDADYVIHEGIKVYAAESTRIDKGVVKVPVYLEKDLGNLKDKLIYYDGVCKSNRLAGIEGVLDCQDNHKHVFVKKKIGQGCKSLNIKKGSILGTVNTVLEVETDEAEKTHWTLTDIRSMVNLENLTAEERERVFNVLFRSQVSFGKDEFDIGKAKVSPHVIELSDSTPIWLKPRSFSEPVNLEIDRQCELLEMMDIIEKCDSRWSSPIVPVRKGDGSLRLCVDYRKINKVTKTENFPIPNLTDSIYRGSNIKYFSKLDLIKGYYQVPVDVNSRKYTAFSTATQQYQFKRLSFGLKNSGIQFQMNMQEIMVKYKHRKIIVYQAEILIMLCQCQNRSKIT